MGVEGLARSTSYYALKSSEETEWMNLIADIHADRPAYGYRKVTAVLKRRGYTVNDKKVRRLMREMGLKSLLPKPRTSIPNKENPTHPYLLKDLKIMKPNQVWAIDITYIKLPVGMVYLFALIDWHSRYIVGWKLAVTMEAEHAIKAFRDGLKLGIPEICNADQGSQFTSELWVIEVSSHGTKISHTGVGRCIDNIRMERFWWTIKYEDIHLKSYETVEEAREGIAKFIKYYNEERPHQVLGYKTPFDVYFGQKAHCGELLRREFLGDDSHLTELVTPSLGSACKERSASAARHFVMACGHSMTGARAALKALPRCKWRKRRHLASFIQNKE